MHEERLRFRRPQVYCRFQRSAYLLFALVVSTPLLSLGTSQLVIAMVPIAFVVPSFAEERANLEQLDIFDRYIRTRQYQEVEPLLLDYIKGHSNSWRAYYQLGYVYFSLHKMLDSIKALSRSLELNIDNPEAHKVLGLNLTIIERYDLAQTELEQAVRLKPDSAEIHYFLGRVYYTKGLYPQAQKEFAVALQLDPAYMKAYDNLGLTLEALGDNAAALSCFQKAVELSEQHKLNSEWPYINLSSFHNRRNQPEPALSYARKAVELNPKAAPAYFQIAKAYQVRAEWEEAAKALTKAIEINPTTPDFYYVLSNVYKQLGNLKESQRAMATFQRLQQESATNAHPGVLDILPTGDQPERQKNEE
jgi:tetratricopeptide (TPR) repeat protein